MANIKGLPKGWEQVVAEEYKEGASDTEVRAQLRITKSLWVSLYNDATSSSFKEVVDVGRMLAKGWWLREGRKALRDKAFNAALWHMNMKNRYGWSDKSEVHTKTSTSMDTDELDDAVTEAVRKAKTLGLIKD